MRQTTLKLSANILLLNILARTCTTDTDSDNVHDPLTLLVSSKPRLKR